MLNYVKERKRKLKEKERIYYIYICVYAYIHIVSHVTRCFVMICFVVVVVSNFS